MNKHKCQLKNELQALKTKSLSSVIIKDDGEYYDYEFVDNIPSKGSVYHEDGIGYKIVNVLGSRSPSICDSHGSVKMYDFYGYEVSEEELMTENPNDYDYCLVEWVEWYLDDEDTLDEDDITEHWKYVFTGIDTYTNEDDFNSDLIDQLEIECGFNFNDSEKEKVLNYISHLPEKLQEIKDFILKLSDEGQLKQHTYHYAIFEIVDYINNDIIELVED